MKKTVLIFSLFVSLFSCNNNNNQNTENQEITQKLYEHFNKHEWQKMADLYIESADFKDPSFGTEITKQTRQQTVQKYSEMEKMFPDIKDEVVQIYSSGENNVIVEFVSTGTAPDGSKFRLPICTIFTIENGKITKDFTYYDNSGNQSPAK